MPLQPTVAVAVITSTRGVLLVQRRDRTPPWAFPGGTIHPGEPPEHAAIRETLDETGLTIQPRGVLGHRQHPRTGRSIIYVAAEPTTSTTVQVADPAALLQVRWVLLADTAGLLPDLFAPVAEHLQRYSQI